MAQKFACARFAAWLKNAFRTQGSKRRSLSPSADSQPIERLEERLLLTVDFQFNYTGEPATNTGFNERANGELTPAAQARRDALESIASDFGNLFATDTTLVVDARDWHEPRQGWLAEVNDTFPTRAQGFANRSVAAHKIIEGEDLNGGSVDGRLGVNWGENHELNPSDVGPGEHDFHATVFHELAHMIGFTAQIRESGNPVFGAGKWSEFDQFVADNTGESLINPETLTIDNARWNAAKEGNTDNGLYFNGPNATFVNGGLVPLYSPSSNGGFDISSSVSHLDDDASGIDYTTHVMVANGRSGRANAHEFHAVEAAIWKDLGFPYIGPNSLDFGDAPERSSANEAGGYDTLLEHDGARHIVYPDLKLGAAIDFEDTNANLNADVTADDSSSDDGIVGRLIAAERSVPTITVNVTNTRGKTATVHGWIDYNGNGLFESTEYATAIVPHGLVAANVELAFPPIPTGSARNTFARFRISTDSAAAAPTGLALDGEVEDYEFLISPPAQSYSHIDSIQLMGRGRASDLIEVRSTTGNENLKIELRDSDGTLLTLGAHGRVSLAGYPAGNYELYVNDTPANIDLTASDTLGEAANEPDAPTVDLDGDGSFEFSTDGVILLAYTLGSRGEALEAFRAAGDSRTGAEIEARIIQLADAIDFDGDGGFQFSTDGLLLLNYALGGRDEALSAFRSTSATRDGSSISSRLAGLLASKASARRQTADQSSSTTGQLFNVEESIPRHTSIVNLPAAQLGESLEPTRRLVADFGPAFEIADFAFGTQQQSSPTWLDNLNQICLAPGKHYETNDQFMSLSTIESLLNM